MEAKKSVKDQSRQDDTEPKSEVGRTYNLMEYYFRAAVALNAVPFTLQQDRQAFPGRQLLLEI